MHRNKALIIWKEKYLKLLSFFFIMKNMNLTFEDNNFNELKKLKNGLSWEKFILKSILKKEETNKQTKNGRRKKE